MIIKPSRVFEGSDFAKHALSGSDLKSTIVDMLGTIVWISETEGFCTCPGAHVHTTGNAKKDCKIYLKPVPTLACFHGSCRVLVEETTKELRHMAKTAAGPTEKKGQRRTPEEKALLAKLRSRESLRRQSATSRSRLLREFQWPYKAIQSDSPIKGARRPFDPLATRA